LVVVNRPVHLLYFYGLWSKQLLPLSTRIDCLVSQSYLGYLKKAGALFDLPISEIYSFEEPVSASYHSKVMLRVRKFAKNCFKYFRIMEVMRAIPLSDYGNILTFADDMLHFQYLIFLYKHQRHGGVVYLADEGVGLYYSVERRSFVREKFKRLAFPHYHPISMGHNPLVDIVLARLPEKCNFLQSQSVEKIDYRITDQEDYSKWCEVFGISVTALTGLREEANNSILFLGTPFEEFGISHDEIIEFLCAVKEVETSNIIVKPHPKEESSSYMQYFRVLPANLPAELLLGKLKFRFVLGYSSSALIEAVLCGQQAYYYNFPADGERPMAKNICNLFEELGIKRYPAMVATLKKEDMHSDKTRGAS